MLKNNLEKAGFDVMGEGLKVLWNPDEEAKESCLEYGEEIARSFAK
jgi:flavorubredoxin